MFLRQRTGALLLVMILIGVIMLVQSVVRYLGPSLAVVTRFTGRMRLAVALVIPFFIFCDCFYFALDSYSLRKLTVAFNACIVEAFMTIFLLSDSILGGSLLNYMEFRLACIMFSLVTGSRPRYLYDSLVFSSCEKTLRINSPRKFTEYMAGSVLACGIRVWNSLPVSARSASSLQGFRRIVRGDFLGISYFAFFLLQYPSISL
jgi:hypothetical protein